MKQVWVIRAPWVEISFGVPPDQWRSRSLQGTGAKPRAAAYRWGRIAWASMVGIVTTANLAKYRVSARYRGDALFASQSRSRLRRRRGRAKSRETRTRRWREMDSKRRSLAEFRQLRSGLKAISKHFSYRTFVRLERAAISDGIERGCRGRETANLRFPGFQPLALPRAKRRLGSPS